MYEEALEWYTGKAKTKAIQAFQNLDRCRELGYWEPGVSRKTRAALNKCNVAHKLAKDLVQYVPTNSDNMWWLANHIAMFGLIERITDTIVTVAKDRAARYAPVDDDQHRRLAIFLADMKPIADIIRTLDASRPVPVISYLGVSHTITNTLADLGLNVKPVFKICPIKYVWIVSKNGQKQPIPILHWPMGTVHGASRFARNQNIIPFSPFDGLILHCHACGHAIRRIGNFVPILCESQNGTPYGLWVGRDCAESLFGIKVTGMLEIKPD